MRDFLDRSRLIIKKNGLWIFLSLLISLLIVSFSTRNQIDILNRSFHSNLNELKLKMELVSEADIYQESYENLLAKKITREELDEATKLYQDIIDKYDISLEDLEKFKNVDYSREYPEDVLAKFDIMRLLSQFKMDFIGEYPEPLEVLTTNNMKMIDKSSDLTESMYLVFFIFILAMLMTSLEHITPFYEFKRMLPWFKTKDFTMKLGLGAIITGLVYIISILLNFAIWRAYYSSDFISFSKFGINLVNNIIILYSFYFLAMGTGAMAGSFIGHGGLMILSGIGLKIVEIFLYAILGAFYGNIPNDNFIFKFQSFMNDQDIFIKTLYSPFYRDSSIKSSLAFLLVAMIVLAIGYFVVAREKEERSGKFVLDKNISRLCFFLASLGGGSLMFLIFSSIIPEGGGIYILFRFSIYALLTYISYRLFKILFDLKIIFR